MNRIKLICYIILTLSMWYACGPKPLHQVTELIAVDPTLLDTVQLQCFNYFWLGEEPVSGAARERIHMDHDYPQHDSDVVTSGGTGFGILTLLIGIERGFITRKQAYDRLLKLTSWLEKADRYHGAWSHWLYPTGKTKPFSQYDDGGDLVETAYLVQGLIAARQYFKQGNKAEQVLAQRMDVLWKSVDWNFYTQGKNVLFWHWSPNHAWQMNFAVRGYNECLIMYILAASSPTHPIDTTVFHRGYMRDGKIVTDREYYDLPTILDHYDTDNKAVGPLFWAHYSYLGIDPHDLRDRYADYWKLNQHHAMIHLRHCIANPNQYKGYSDECWGLTSSYSMSGYAGHSPQEDLGVISPTAALSSFPYTPEASMKFLNFLYRKQPHLIGVFGPFDAFSFQSNWSVPHYLAIDQLTIPVMIENYRTGLLWNLVMSAPEVQVGLTRLGFRYKKRKVI